MKTSGKYDIFPGISKDVQDPTGFLDQQNVVVSYDSTTRKITLTHSSGVIEYLFNGSRRQLASPWVSDAHADTAGAKYLFSTDGETFSWSDTPWSFENIQVAYVAPGKIFALRECHGTMQFYTHQELHIQIGTYRRSGFGLVAGTYDLQPAVPSDAGNTPSFANGIINDEDLPSVLPEWAEGSYTTLHFTGSGTPVFTDGASSLLRVTGTYPNFNQYSGGTFSEVEAATNNYLNYYIIRMPVTADSESQKYRAIVLQPQQVFSTLAGAQGESLSDIELGELETLSPEFVLVEKVTFRTSAAYVSTGKARIEEVSILTGSAKTQFVVTGSSISSITDLSDTPATIGANVIWGGNAGGTALEAKPVTISDNTIVLGNSSIVATYLKGKVYVKNAFFSNQENLDVDSGSAQVIATIPFADCTAVFFNYSIKNGVNLRAGTIQAIHDGSNVEYNESATNDLGDTSDVTLSVDISGSDIRLLATTLSDNWVIKTLINAL